MGTENVEKSEISKEISELDKKIIRQVEYYFGNFNLCKDKFLREQVKLDDGWVPLETLIKFNRLKSLTEDFNVICEALKKSPNELMEVNEDFTKIRRRVEKPIPEETSTNRAALEERTLYVKGFKKNTTLDELLEFFKEHKAENVLMRRHKVQKGKPFKGSCFVLFETKEDAEKFLNTKEIKYENTELLKEKQGDYTKRKDIYYDNLRAEKEKKVLKKESEGKGDEDKVNENKVNENKEMNLIPGCLIKICGLGEPCSREDIKEVFQEYGNVVYVDYFRGNPEAVLRFDTAVAASVIEKAVEEDGEKKIDILSFKATISVVEGDAEKEYWKNIAISKANARKKPFNKQNKGRFNKNNKNWGGRQKRNRRDDDGAEQRSFKRQKVESNEGKDQNIEKSKDDGSEQPSAKRQKVESNEERNQNTEKSNGVEKETPKEPSKSSETSSTAADAVC